MSGRLRRSPSRLVVCPERKFRILLVTHAPLSPDYGAAQIALNLGDALRRSGHEAVVWSPHPLRRARTPWGGLRLMREKLEAFVAAQAPFDVIDAPASLITKRMSGAALTVARSVQPDLRYLFVGLLENVRPTIKAMLSALISAVYIIYQGALVVRGWSRADIILCLGQLELQWMENRFPKWKPKLRFYLTTISEIDRERLSAVRNKRVARSPNEPIRFLWLGRWVRHKGVEDLERFARAWLAAHPRDSITVAGCGIGAEAMMSEDFRRSRQLRIIPSYRREELPEILSNHDVGLFTSSVEGWGLNLNEMLESGMPVFATRAGGVPDLKPYFPGLLQPFPPSDSAISSRALPSEEEWAAYRVSFVWSSIASEYLTTCSTARARR